MNIKSVKPTGTPPDKEQLDVSKTVKSVEESKGQPDSVTVIAPDDAPVGTSATICVAVCDTMVAETPPNSTVELPVNPVPVIVTSVNSGPFVGTKPVMVCVGVQAVTVKFNAESTSQPASVTVITPVVAPAGTIAVNVVLFTNVTAAGVPLNCTAELAVKPVPEIVIVAPIAPDDGENPEIVCVGVQEL